MGALFGGVSKSSYFNGLSARQYYVPIIAALSVLGSCYGQLAVALAARRQNGILKRVRATPLPAWAFFAGLLAHCVLVSVVDVALIVGTRGLGCARSGRRRPLFRMMLRLRISSATCSRT
jgi:ABC-2 type transport system permease protein